MGTSAVSRVFTTYELTEAILAELTLPDLLRMARVCKTCHEIIVASKSLVQRHCWYEKRDYGTYFQWIARDSQRMLALSGDGEKPGFYLDHRTSNKNGQGRILLRARRLGHPEHIMSFATFKEKVSGNLWRRVRVYSGSRRIKVHQRYTTERRSMHLPATATLGDLYDWVCASIGRHAACEQSCRRPGI